MRSMLLVVVCYCLTVAGGCAWWDGWTSTRAQSPDSARTAGKDTRLVGDLAVSFGLHPLVTENVGLVVGLRGTGSDPEPSHNREAMLTIMRKHGVQQPDVVLASKNTALVLVQGVLRPGIQKGDRFDLRVRVPSRSETTSLHGGRLMECRLKETAVLADNRIHDGHTLGVASGAVMIEPGAQEDSVDSRRGVILGGGVSLTSRPVALLTKPEHRSVFNAARIETVVNRRFHTLDRGVNNGVASAKTDEYIELKVHPRYQDNIERYVRVVRSLALRENEHQRVERVARLARLLNDPITSSRAAVQLEALGRAGVEALKQGLASTDPEIRFHAAESLAYLDESDAAEVLAQIARDEPAFRVFALNALGAMEGLAAHDALRGLLHVASVETRYGAFRALRTMNPSHSLVAGEVLGDEFGLHLVDCRAEPMIHTTRSRRAELVLFGPDQRLAVPMALDAGNRILVTGSDPEAISVARFGINEEDQKRIVSSRVEDIVRAIVELGGTYPDVVQALEEASDCGALAGRFEVEALPEAGRTYQRTARLGGEVKRDEEIRQVGFLTSGPLRKLFQR